MSSPQYPVVEQRALRAPSRRGLFGMLNRRRDASEIPDAAAHQVLVYRSGGSFHVDTGAMALDDGRVVEADHVSLVDVGHDTTVEVTLTIPSLEDDEFEVRTSFSCTVTDPVAVVKEGRGDAHRFLTDYLRRYDKLPQVAQHLRLRDINEVRELVWSHVKAFIDLAPPEVRGMRIRYVGTEVPTPASLRDVRKEWGSLHHTQEVEVARTAHDHRMKAMVTEHTQRIMAGLSEAVQNDTINAIMLALAEERIDTTEVIQRITHERERVLAREDQRKAEEHEEQLRREEVERQERQQREEWERATAERRETWDREDRLRKMQIRSDLARTAMEQHHVEGTMYASDIVDFVDPELLPFRSDPVGGSTDRSGIAGSEVEELPAGETLAEAPETSEEPGNRAASDRTEPAQGSRRDAFAGGLSEDDHGA
ncbi:hypothetical protein [Nocardiopsis lucentensis]|uniref:hypothetical protein n=1 Tax=Nocardiopsis lucentensis TaxID=53441 RepID=UPI00034D1CEF|nr:hypothetical protein [Nocardiopsis lucentensis]